MISLILATLVFISDVQINSFSSYPDSIATVISNEIGSGIVYDAGDLVENGLYIEEQEYERYKQLFPYSIPVPGNHDSYDGLNYWVWTNVVDVYDSGIHIVGFDTGEMNNPMSLDWLRTVLDDGQGQFTILFMHHQVFSDNVRNGAISTRIREVFLPIIEDTDVDLVICGHGHAYERHSYNYRTYLVIGGGGAPLDAVGSSYTQIMSSSEHHWVKIDATPDGVDVQAIGFNGVIDSFSIANPIILEPEKTSWGNVKGLFR